MAERIRAAVASQTLESADAPFRVTVSIGVSSARNQAGLSPQRLLREADAALYEAKAARNAVRVFRRRSAP